MADNQTHVSDRLIYVICLIYVAWLHKRIHVLAAEPMRQLRLLSADPPLYKLSVHGWNVSQWVREAHTSSILTRRAQPV